MAPIPREERILNLLSALLAARSPLSFAEIRERVAGYDDEASEDALEKRFDRDKQDLRTLGVPLEYVAEDSYGRAGYRIARERFFLEEIRFTSEEGIVLAALTQDVLDDDAAPPLEGLRSALAKVSVDSPLPGGLRDSVGEQQSLDARVSHRIGEESERLAVLGEALFARRPVTFRYYTLERDEESERTVETWGIGYFQGNWYVVGWCRDRDGVRTFRVSRIRGPVSIADGPAYVIPDDFDLKDRLGRSPWELRGDDAVETRIRFDPDVAWMLAENVRPGQEFESDPEGGGTLSLAASDTDALIRWVAQYGESAEILSPPALRDRMVEHFRGILARYAS